MSATFLTDLQHAGQYGNSVAPQTIASATTVNGTAVDLAKSDGPVTAILNTGDCGDGTLTLSVKLQEAIEDPASKGNPLSSDWSDVVNGAFANYTGATLADILAVALQVKYRTKRFVRAVVVTAGGGTLSVPIQVGILSRLKISGTGDGHVS
jgi:hypothetical protein